MIYEITARFRDSEAATFHGLLTDGTIAGQKPDGTELVASMNRAVLLRDGRVRWSETCYCDPPLAHERATVLDRFFTDMEIEPIGEPATYQGPGFMSHLAKLAAG